MENARPALFTRMIIWLIIVVQLALGVVFIFMPERFPSLMGLEAAPAWTGWIFAQFGARCIGFAFGLVWAMRDIQRHASWLWAMIIVQVIDWVGTVIPLFKGTLTLSQVSTAPFLPVLFIVVLLSALIRRGQQSKN